MWKILYLQVQIIFQLSCSSILPLTEGRSFWFEWMWAANPGCQSTIEIAWMNSALFSYGCGLPEKLAHLVLVLHNWYKASFGSLTSKIKEFMESLQRTYALPLILQLEEDTKKATQDLGALPYIEEILWAHPILID